MVGIPGESVGRGMEGSSWIIQKNAVQSLLDFKSALPSLITIVMYLGGAEERHPRHVPARGAYVVFMEGR